jgi:hypothetical protein
VTEQSKSNLISRVARHSNLGFGYRSYSPESSGVNDDWGWVSFAFSHERSPDACFVVVNHSGLDFGIERGLIHVDRAPAVGCTLVAALDLEIDHAVGCDLVTAVD